MGGDVLVELGHPFAANEVALPAQGQGIPPFRFKSIQPNGRDVTPGSVIVEVHLTANRRVCHIKHPSDFCGLKGGGAFDATTMCLYAYGTTRCLRREPKTGSFAGASIRLLSCGSVGQS